MTPKMISTRRRKSIIPTKFLIVKSQNLLIHPIWMMIIPKACQGICLGFPSFMNKMSIPLLCLKMMTRPKRCNLSSRNVHLLTAPIVKMKTK